MRHLEPIGFGLLLVLIAVLSVELLTGGPRVPDEEVIAATVPPTTTTTSTLPGDSGPP